MDIAALKAISGRLQQRASARVSLKSPRTRVARDFATLDQEAATSILSMIARLEALEEALSFHVRNCPLCRGKRKAISAWDLLTKDNPEETECERCAPGWALLSTEPVQS